MYVEGLCDIISSYEYGQYNLLEHGTNIWYNPLTSQLQLDPFFGFDLPDRRGSCAELAEKAYREISDMYPDLHVFRASGYEPSYFNQGEAQHAFLLVGYEDLLPGKWHSGGRIDMDHAHSRDPLLVDPALGRVQQLSDSGYELHYLLNHGCPMRYSKSLTLFHEQKVPLGLPDGENLLYIEADLESEQLVQIGVQEPAGPMQVPERHSAELHGGLSQDQYTQAFVRTLQECPRQVSYKPLRDRDEILCR